MISSKFKKKLSSKNRRSAFCVVPPTDAADRSRINATANTVQKSNTQPNNAPHRMGTKSKSKSDRSQAGTECDIRNHLQNIKITRSAAVKHLLGASIKSECETKPAIDSKLPSINGKSLRTRTRTREQILMQEREDFQLAKMLQAYDGDGDGCTGAVGLTGPSGNQRKYFLRSRNKAMPSSAIQSPASLAPTATKLVTSESSHSLNSKFAILSTRNGHGNGTNGIIKNCVANANGRNHNNKSLKHY